MRIKHVFPFLITFFASVVIGCTEKENEPVTDYKLTTQAAVDAFTVTDDILTLVIEGEGITDLSKLKMQTVNDLTISGTSVEDIVISGLNSITGSLTIKNNPKLTKIAGIQNLKFINGRVSIEDNNALVDLSGFMGLKQFTGELSVTGNKLLGKNAVCTDVTKGFCVIKHLVESDILRGNVVLANNHPDAATTVPQIGQLPGSNIISYTILSKADADNFTPLSDTIMDIKIAGADITNTELKSIGSKIKWVKGTVTLENTNVTTTEGNLFDQAYCNGSIVLRNNPKLDNGQGFKNYKKINGDLIIENCPNMTYWNSGGGGGVSFSSIERIEGDFRINPARKLDSGGGGFSKLSYVGGTFELIGDPTGGEIWNLETWFTWGGGIKHIGGDLVFKNHYKVNGLAGFQALEYIGGDVYVLDNGGPDGYIPLKTVGGQIGFCIFKDLFNKGVMKKENVKIMLRVKAGDPYLALSELSTCN